MSVLALAAVRSCGVTTLALSLATTWPDDRRVLLAEFDPAGGTLAAALGWPPEPGVVSLAAAARRGGDPDLIWGHCQSLEGGASVLAGPASGEQARHALGILAGLMGRLGEIDADVLIDCGRLESGSLSLGAVAGSDGVVLVARPQLSDLHALATWADNNPVDCVNLGVVLVGDGPYSDNEVGDALGMEVLARLPWDPSAAAALVGAPASARQLRVAPLVRAARSLAGRLGAESGPASREGHDEAAEPEQSLPKRGQLSRVLRTRAARVRSEPGAQSPNGTKPEAMSQ